MLRLRLALAFGLAFVLWHAADLSLYPAITDDEVLLNDPARALAEHGNFDSPLLTPDHRPRPVLIQPPVQAISVAAVYKLIGFGLWQTRFASVLWGAVAIALLAAVIQVFFRAKAAAPVAVLLLFVNPSFSITARAGRMDTLCLAFILAAYYSYRAARSDPSARKPLVLAGVFVALACLTHPVAVSVLMGFTLLVAFAFEGRQLRALLLFTAGGLLVAAAWGVVIVRGGPHYLTDLISHGSMRATTGPLPTRVMAECLRWFTEIRRVPFLFACYVAGIAWRSVWPSDRRAIASELSLLGVVAFVFNALIMSKMSGYYPLYPQLFLTMLAAGSIAVAIERGGHYRRAALILLGAAVMASVPLLVLPRVAAVTVQRRARDYSPIREQLQAAVPTGSTVWSVPEGWYGLQGRSVRTPSLDYNLVPNARVDQFAVANANVPLTDPAFEEIRRIGDEIPAWHGRTFAITDYRLIVYRSRLLR